MGDGNGGHLEGKRNHWGFISVIYNDFIKNNVNVFFHSPGGEKSILRVSACLILLMFHPFLKQEGRYT